jgi:hypothetical protein
MGLPKSMLLQHGDTTVQWMKQGYLSEEQLTIFGKWIDDMIPNFIADWRSMKKVRKVKLLRCNLTFLMF